MEHEAEYVEFLNEVHKVVVISGIEFDPARILKECDPIAYEVGYSDWEDGAGYGE